MPTAHSPRSAFSNPARGDQDPAEYFQEDRLPLIWERTSDAPSASSPVPGRGIVGRGPVSGELTRPATRVVRDTGSGGPTAHGMDET
ncbi:MAG: hypothetical protein ACRDG4_15060 [Chloroflexota bacterium]